MVSVTAVRALASSMEVLVGGAGGDEGCDGEPVDPTGYVVATQPAQWNRPKRWNNVIPQVSLILRDRLLLDPGQAADVAVQKLSNRQRRHGARLRIRDPCYFQARDGQSASTRSPNR